MFYFQIIHKWNIAWNYFFITLGCVHHWNWKAKHACLSWHKMCFLVGVSSNLVSPSITRCDASDLAEMWWIELCWTYTSLWICIMHFCSWYCCFVKFSLDLDMLQFSLHCLVRFDSPLVLLRNQRGEVGKFVSHFGFWWQLTHFWYTALENYLYICIKLLKVKYIHFITHATVCISMHFLFTSGKHITPLTKLFLQLYSRPGSFSSSDSVGKKRERKKKRTKKKNTR